jgi:hypothetical protein
VLLGLMLLQAQGAAGQAVLLLSQMHRGGRRQLTGQEQQVQVQLRMQEVPLPLMQLMQQVQGPLQKQLRALGQVLRVLQVQGQVGSRQQ